MVFSGDFGGAPVDVRAFKNGHPMAPGVAHFDPNRGTTSFTFTFTANGGGPSCRVFSMAWRSPTGKQVTMHYGTFLVTYDAARTAGSGICE